MNQEIDVIVGGILEVSPEEDLMADLFRQAAEEFRISDDEEDPVLRTMLLQKYGIVPPRLLDEEKEMISATD